MATNFVLTLNVVGRSLAGYHRLLQLLFSNGKTRGFKCSGMILMMGEETPETY
jgi:hypothetical protein